VPLSIQELSDRAEIDQLLARYCHALDERDWTRSTTTRWQVASAGG
jgi:hypothetical protein